jgi:aspartyl-tRNA(Asn)/glutamyl-tRNA(Gln) amidotransferase subunit A
MLDEGHSTSAAVYRSALEHQQVLRDRIADVLAGVDAWVMPSTKTAAPPLDSTGDPRLNSPWSYTGLPAVTLPCGLAASNGTPIGLQLVGQPFRDAALLDCAEWCERQIAFSAAPRLLTR